MKVEVRSRKQIKPCLPTPSNLQSFKISYLDEIAHPINFCVILYYSPGASTERLQRLEESLAEILPQFYPLAGRYIKEKHLVDCSDQGVEYVQAQVDIPLLEHINSVKVKSCDLYCLTPCNVFAIDEVTDPLLAIQVSKFSCGGLAICFSASHRVVDAASLDTFIAALASASRRDINTYQTICPVFDSSLLIPGRDTVSDHDSDAEEGKKPSGAGDANIVSKRFLFDKTAISSLRAKAMSSELEESAAGKRPISRVRLVSALIVQTLAQIDQKKYGKFKAIAISHAVNIRQRTVPPLPEYSCGNLQALSVGERSAEQCLNMEFQDFVHFGSDSKTLAICAEITSDPEKIIQSLIDTWVETIVRAHMNDGIFLCFTDWSKLKLYEADFGWGKPIWVSVPNARTKNLFILVDNKESDGLEAWVHLDAQDMSYFQQSEEITMFTTS